MYSPEHIERAKEELLKQFDLLCEFEFGKITINMNRQASMIEIVPELHIRIKKNTDKLDK